MDKLITIIELKELLNISRSKAYELVKMKDFPIVRIGKCIRINKNDLFEWLQKQKSMI